MSFIDDINYLRLPFIRDNLEALLAEAEEEKKSYQQFLEDIFSAEAASRRENAIRKRIREAHLPICMTLDQYERAHLSEKIQRVILKLSTLEFIDKKENIILTGDPGTGKTALACTLGLEAILKGKNVLFVKIHELLTQLKEAMSQEEIRKFYKKFEKYDVVILDELGYLHADEAAGDLLFNLLSSRYGKGTIIITSNLPIQDWNEIFKNEMYTAALTDRLSHRTWPLNMSGKSFRMIDTQRWMEKEMASL